MQDFLDKLSNLNIKEINTIKAMIAENYNSLFARKIELLGKNPPLANSEIFELCELQGSLLEIAEILQLNTEPQVKLNKFRGFLQNRWERIRKTFLDYTYSASLPITKFCHAMAKLLAAQTTDQIDDHTDDQKSAYQILMPTLKNTKNKIFEEEFLDDLPLGTFMLDEEDAYPICISILVNQDSKDSYGGYFCWKMYKGSESERNILYNAYKGFPISNKELEALIQFSAAGRTLESACTTYLNITEEADGSLRYHLTKLADELWKCSAYSDDPVYRGTPEKAHEHSVAAKESFRAFLDTLPEEIKTELLALHPGEGYDPEITFGYTLKIFAQNKEVQGQLACDGVESKKIRKILANPAYATPLDNNSVKTSRLDKARNDFNACLAQFELVFTDRDAFSAASLYCPYNNSPKQICVMLAYVIYFLGNSDSFGFNDPIERTVFLDSLRHFVCQQSVTKEIFKREKTERFFLIIFIIKHLSLNPHTLLDNFIKDIHFEDSLNENSVEMIRFFCARYNLNFLGFTLKNGGSFLYWLVKNKSTVLLDLILEKNPNSLVLHDSQGNTTLHWAAEKNDLEAMQYLLQKKVDINIKDIHQGTPLICAVRKKHFEAVNYLLEMGANVSLIDQNNDSAAHWAANGGLKDVLKKLLGKDPSLCNSKNNDQYTPLHLAALRGYSDCACVILEQSSILQIDAVHDSALSLAVAQNHAPVVKLLLEAGANLNLVNHQGQTPIRLAILKKNWACIIAIAEFKKITPDEKNDLLNYNQALCEAAKNNQTAVVEALINAGAHQGISWKITKDNENNQIVKEGYAIHHAVANNNLEMVRILLKNNPDAINYLTSTKETPLHIAAKKGYIGMFALLIKAGANCDLKSSNGRNPSDLLIIHCENNMKIILNTIELYNSSNYLKDRLPNLDQFFDIKGRTPLTFAVENNDIDMATHLLELNINPGQPDNLAQIPLSIAIQNANKNIVKVLLDKGVDPNQTNKNLPPLVQAVCMLKNNDQEIIIQIISDLLNKGANPYVIYGAGENIFDEVRLSCPVEFKKICSLFFEKQPPTIEILVSVFKKMIQNSEISTIQYLLETDFQCHDVIHSAAIQASKNTNHLQLERLIEAKNYSQILLSFLNIESNSFETEDQMIDSYASEKMESDFSFSDTAYEGLGFFAPVVGEKRPRDDQQKDEEDIHVPPTKKNRQYSDDMMVDLPDFEDFEKFFDQKPPTP